MDWTFCGFSILLYVLNWSCSKGDFLVKEIWESYLAKVCKCWFVFSCCDSANKLILLHYGCSIMLLSCSSFSTMALLLFIILFILLFILLGAESLTKHDEKVLFCKTDCVLEKLWLQEESRNSSEICFYSMGMMKSVWVCCPCMTTLFFFFCIGDLLLDLSGETFLFLIYFLLSFNNVMI